jgi:hypothetical protein
MTVALGLNFKVKPLQNNKAYTHLNDGSLPRMDDVRLWTTFQSLIASSNPNSQKQIHFI